MILNDPTSSQQVKSLGSFIKRPFELRTGGTCRLHLLYCETASLFVYVFDSFFCLFVAFDPILGVSCANKEYY